MKSSALLALALTVSFATSALAKPAARTLAAELDTIVARRFPPNGPGAAVLVRKGDSVLLRKGYGSADLELDVPMRPEYIFRLGSITKQFTAAAIMMLAEQGKLALADDIRKYVPDYLPKGAPVTIEQLLTHTGGVPSYTSVPAFRLHARDDLTHAQVVAMVKDLPLDFAPGTKWSYSNTGYFLLGMVIEKASGKRYDAFLAERIFQPLGMSHTRYGDVEPIIPGRIPGYDRVGAGYQNLEFVSMSGPFAAGALISSVDDLARWDRAITDGKLLQASSWSRIFTPERLKDGSDTRYGFGWSIGAVQGHRVVSHGGAIPGFNAEIARLPDDGVLVVVLCNSSPGVTNPGDLALRLAASAIGKPIVDPQPVTLAPEILDRYAGVYLADDKTRAVVRRDGTQLTVLQSGGHMTLDAESDGRFFIRNLLTRIVFTHDDGGRVTGFDRIGADGNVEHFTRTDQPLPAPRVAVAVDAQLLDGYVGRYELAPGFVITISREATQMFAQATGQDRLELFASAPAEFFLTVVDAQISFVVGKSGRAEALILHQNGHDSRGKRLP